MNSHGNLCNNFTVNPHPLFIIIVMCLVCQHMEVEINGFVCKQGHITRVLQPGTMHTPNFKVKLFV